MADDVPEYEYDGLDSGLFEWLYVEDDYGLADELAETQVASPGYSGTKQEIDLESYDFDIYDYWDDLQYGDDEYWDNGGVGVATTTTTKRKREEPAVQSSSKRRKLSLKETAGDNVRFMNVGVRVADWEPPVLERPTAFALLPDWRQRFAGEDGEPVTKSMPEAMKKAAEGRGEESPSKGRQVDAGEEDEWEDEDEEGDEDALSGLDPEMLKAVLKQKLGDAGLEDLDEGAFMQTISQMLSGGDGADDAAGDLANSLLGKAAEGNDSALSGWLSQQGVSLDAAEEEGEAGSAATAKQNQVSPSDSAVDVLKAPPSAKRPAPSENEAGAQKKRKISGGEKHAETGATNEDTGPNTKTADEKKKASPARQTTTRKRKAEEEDDEPAPPKKKKQAKKAAAAAAADPAAVVPENVVDETTAGKRTTRSTRAKDGGR